MNQPFSPTTLVEFETWKLRQQAKLAFQLHRELPCAALGDRGGSCSWYVSITDRLRLSLDREERSSERQEQLQ